MSLYREWLKKRGLLEGLADGEDPSAKFKHSTDDVDMGEDYERTQNELFKSAMSKYPEETIDFFNTLAQRGDEEIGNLLKHLRKDKGVKLARGPVHPDNRPEVVPAVADMGHNPAGGFD